MDGIRIRSHHMCLRGVVDESHLLPTEILNSAGLTPVSLIVMVGVARTVVEGVTGELPPPQATNKPTPPASTKWTSLDCLPHRFLHEVNKRHLVANDCIPQTTTTNGAAGDSTGTVVCGAGAAFWNR